MIKISKNSLFSFLQNRWNIFIKIRPKVLHNFIQISYPFYVGI